MATQRLHITLPTPLIAQIRALAKREAVTLGTMIRLMLRDHMKIVAPAADLRSQEKAT
jgi:hypothetical protein